MKYRDRLQDAELAFRLECSGAVLIEGPKWCGKTTLAEHQAKSILRMQDPDKKQGYLQTAMAKPSLLLAGDNPRLIDEWQEAPVLWDAVRLSVDSRGRSTYHSQLSQLTISMTLETVDIAVLRSRPVQP